MRWTQAAPLTNGAESGRRSRVVLMPRRWHQVLEKQTSQGRRWQTSPVTGESAKETVKTIARGMPDVSGVTVVTNACAFYHCTRGCGRAERPAFPAPSELRGRNEQAKPRAKSAARSRSCVRRHCLRQTRSVCAREPTGRANARPMTGSATKQSILSLLDEMDCFAEPVIGRRFAPTRWLAMTVFGPLLLFEIRIRKSAG
jgi:hypothetical protein